MHHSLSGLSRHSILAVVLFGAAAVACRPNAQPRSGSTGGAGGASGGSGGSGGNSSGGSGGNGSGGSGGDSSGAGQFAGDFIGR